MPERVDNVSEEVCENLNMKMVYTSPDELPFPDSAMADAISEGAVVVEFDDDGIYGLCEKTRRLCPYLGIRLDKITIIPGETIDEMKGCKNYLP